MRKVWVVLVGITKPMITNTVKIQELDELRQTVSQTYSGLKYPLRLIDKLKCLHILSYKNELHTYIKHNGYYKHKQGYPSKSCKNCIYV